MNGLPDARPMVAVVGGGLAGMTAALDAADAGARVVLFERRPRLGGATWSFRHGNAWFDNGQHVFLRCCVAYRALLERLGVDHLVHIQRRMTVPVLRPGRPRAHLSRDPLPAPMHLARALSTYAPLSPIERLRAARAARALTKLRPEDPALDGRTFGAWLTDQRQSSAAIDALWDLICLPTVNLHAAQASLALATKVFQTGLLNDADGADIGWARVPLGRLHGDAGLAALTSAGVEVRTSAPVVDVAVTPQGFAVAGDPPLEAAAVVLAVPPDDARRLAPPDAGLDGAGLASLGTSPIVNVHLVYDRKVMDIPFAAALGSPVQFVFDRTEASGVGSGQAIAVSLSAADDLITERSDALIDRYRGAIADIFPVARGAHLVDALVIRERAATFRGIPGTAALRPGPATALPGLALAGAWTATGWPATMEGAVRSGHAAARVALSALGRSRRLPEEVDA